MSKVSNKYKQITKVICLDTILSDFVAIERNKFRNGKDDNESLSILIDTPLCQSEKIQFGCRMENILSTFIMRNSLYKNIREKKSKGKKETDHLFMDVDRKIIYYAELKSNLNLDTEKSAETVRKCLKIEKMLIDKYPGYEIRMFLVGLRHLTSSTIRKEVKSKYNEISNKLIGVNEYLLKIGIQQQEEFRNEKNYKIFINKFVEMLRSHN